MVGWCGFGCSFNGRWFRSYSGSITTKEGTTRNYQSETIRNIKKQSTKLNGVNFIHSSYDKLTITEKSVIYCDPPYIGTTGYKDKFDHDRFYEWGRNKVKEGHILLVSEYTMPEDFICIWSKEINCSLSATSNTTKRTEKLFCHKDQEHIFRKKHKPTLF